MSPSSRDLAPTMKQKSFIVGARSLDEGDLHDNLTYFKVPQADIDSIRSKLTFKIFDECANTLKGMPKHAYLNPAETCLSESYA